MREDERCRHPDCIYRAKDARDTKHTAGRCNYLSITGRSRIAGLPDRLQLPCNCAEYVPDGSDPARAESWKDRAFALYHVGATDKEIAQATGISLQHVGTWRRRNGLSLHKDKKGPEPVFDWKKAKELYRRGLNDAEIAKALGCGTSCVWRWRYKHELLPNGRAGRKKEVRR